MFSKGKLARMYFPVLMDNASQILLGIITSVMLSALGEHVITATSMVTIIATIATTVIASVTTGAIVKVSQYVGAKNTQACKKTARQSILASVSLACILTALMFVFGESIVEWLLGDAEQKILDTANLYYKIYILSLPFFALFSISNGIVYGTGDFKRTMANSFMINAGNVLISAFFIYVLKLGVVGAGISIILCRALCGACVYLQIRKGTHFIRVEKAITKPDFKTIGSVLKIGIPTAIDGLIITGSNLTVQSFIVALGSTAMAAHAIVSNLINFVLIAGNAVGSMGVTVVGQCFGAGNMKMCRKYMLYMVIAGSVFTILSSGIGVAFADNLLGMYNPEAETFALAKKVFITAVLMYSLLWSPAFVTPAGLRGCGDVRYSTIVSIISLTVVKLPITWLFTTHMNMGLMGIWLAIAAEWITRIIFIVPRALSQKWEKQERV